jgi:signal transduction histidine kinase
MHRVTDVRAAWRWRGGLLGDAVVSVVATALLLVVSVHEHAGTRGRPLDAVGFAALVAAGGALGLCRRWPRAAVAVVTVALAVFVARPYPNGPVWATGWIALAALSWQTGRRTALVLAGGMLAVLSVAAVAFGSAGLLLPLIFVGWSAAAVFLGEALRNRRSYLAGLAERAKFLERTREEEARRRVAEERLRIARDLHDSVAHAMVTINVQAGAAAHVLARRPEAVGGALAAIQRASGEVLDELTSMLAVLRDDVQRADRAPAPGIGQIPWLAEAAGDSGLTVELHMEGPAATVPGVLGTAAYRVVQESLTNVARHSQAKTATVRVIAGEDAALTVEVCDPGPAAHGGAAGTGVGVLGMTERVTSTGGRLEAGPAPHGGFVVRAAWDRRP